MKVDKKQGQALGLLGSLAEFRFGLVSLFDNAQRNA